MTSGCSCSQVKASLSTSSFRMLRMKVRQMSDSEQGTSCSPVMMNKEEAVLAVTVEPPHIVRTVQKRGLQGGRTSESKTGLAKRERSQASLCLEALVVIEVDVLVDQIGKSTRLNSSHQR